MCCIVTALLVIGAAQLLQMLEPMPGGFADGLWWAVVTTTTVGYGDIAPKTAAGRIVAVMLMLSSTALIATVAASVSAYFVSAERTEEYEDLKARLSRIETMLKKSTSQAPDQSTQARSRYESDSARPNTPHQ